MQLLAEAITTSTTTITIFGIPSDVFVAVCISVIVGVYIRIESWWTNSKIKRNTELTTGTQTIVNGRMDQLLEEVRQSAHAKGVIEGLRQAAEKAAAQALAEKNLAIAASQQKDIDQLKSQT